MRHGIWITTRNFVYMFSTQWIFFSDHDDVINRKHFPRYLPFVRGTHRSTVNSPHKGQWRGALILFFIFAWTNGWANDQGAGHLRRHCGHCNVTVIYKTAHLPGQLLNEQVCMFFNSHELFGCLFCINSYHTLWNQIQLPQRCHF